MKKSIGKVTLNNSIAPESPRNGASGAEKVMPYEAPRVEVVKYQVEHGFVSSSEKTDATCQDMGLELSVGTTAKGMTDWDTFQW